MAVRPSRSRLFCNSHHAGTVRRVDVDSGRVEVLLDGSGESVLIKPDNAAPEPAADAE